MITLRVGASEIAFFGCALSLLLGFAPRQEHRQEKGRALLRSWLTSEQAQQWDFHKHFEVTGCDTGTRYRIRHGTAMNIDELDSSGKMIAQWCFAPQGNLVAGDVMLAQKIALETMENEALAAANRFSPSWPF